MRKLRDKLEEEEGGGSPAKRGKQYKITVKGDETLIVGRNTNDIGGTSTRVRSMSFTAQVFEKQTQD